MQQKTANSAGVLREMTVARWLFNPFVRIGGERALTIGLTGIVLSGLVAAAGEVHFGGLLRLSTGFSVPSWVPVVEGLVIWSVMSALFILVSLLIAPRTVRVVDTAGTQALARAPLLLAVVAHLPASVREGNREFVAAALDGRLVLPTAGTSVAAVVSGVCAVWMVALMWKAFAVSCNQRGGRAVALFVAAVIVGDVVTRFLLTRMLGDLVAAGVPGAG